MIQIKSPREIDIMAHGGEILLPVTFRPLDGAGDGSLKEGTDG